MRRRSVFLSWSFDQVLNRLEYRLDLLPVLVLPPFELFQSSRQLLMSSQELSQPDRGPHDRYVDLNGPFTPENGGQHGDALLREGIRQIASSAAGSRLRFQIGISKPRLLLG
jgi:hypothetical protein